MQHYEASSYTLKNLNLILLFPLPNFSRKNKSIIPMYFHKYQIVHLKVYGLWKDTFIIRKSEFVSFKTDSPLTYSFRIWIKNNLTQFHPEVAMCGELCFSISKEPTDFRSKKIYRNLTKPLLSTFKTLLILSYDFHYFISVKSTK